MLPVTSSLSDAGVCIAFLLLTGRASFHVIATHCRHLQALQQKEMNSLLCALLSTSACGAGCCVDHGAYSLDPLQPSLFCLCKALIWVQEVISWSIWQPYGDFFIRRQSRGDLRVLQVFDGSQGVKLCFRGASKTRVLQSSCPLLPHSSAADVGWCCLNSCCQPEWT